MPSAAAKQEGHFLPSALFLSTAVLSSLRQLSVSTSILTNPAGIPEQATQAVTGADPKDSPS